MEVFTALRDYMNEGNLARTFECSEDDAAMIATSDLLTLRKTIYAANLSETDVNAPESCSYFTQVQALAAKEGSEVLPICAKARGRHRRARRSGRKRPCSWKSWA